MLRGVYVQLKKPAKERQLTSMDIYLVLKVAESIRHLQVRDRSKFVGTQAGTIDIKGDIEIFFEKS